MFVMRRPHHWRLRLRRLLLYSVQEKYSLFHSIGYKQYGMF